MNNRRTRIYEGKAKILYEGPEPGTVIVIRFSPSSLPAVCIGEFRCARMTVTERDHPVKPARFAPARVFGGDSVSPV